MGGHEPMSAHIDSMFVAPNTYNYGTYGFVIHEIAEMVALNMGQYAHGNQPVQHAILSMDSVPNLQKGTQPTDFSLFLFQIVSIGFSSFLLTDAERIRKDLICIGPTIGIY